MRNLAVLLTLDAAERIAALRKFVEDFPKSKEKNRASRTRHQRDAPRLPMKNFGRAKKREHRTFQTRRSRNAETRFRQTLHRNHSANSEQSFLSRRTRRGKRHCRLIEEKADGNAKQLLGAGGVLSRIGKRRRSQTARR
jgi:hypothetical protein